MSQSECSNPAVSAQLCDAFRGNRKTLTSGRAPPQEERTEKLQFHNKTSPFKHDKAELIKAELDKPRCKSLSVRVKHKVFFESLSDLFMETTLPLSDPRHTHTHSLTAVVTLASVSSSGSDLSYLHACLPV